MKLPRFTFGPISRSRLLGAGLFFLGLLVTGRLVQLMVFDHQLLATLAKNQSEDALEIPGPRGDIVDRQGRLLATSVPVQVLAVEPKELNRSELAAIEKAAGVPGRLTSRAGQRYLLVRRDCDESIVAQVNQVVEALPKDKRQRIHWGPGFKRFYPQGVHAAHVLGFVSLDETVSEGVEKQFNQLLRSAETRVLRATDARGRGVASLSGSPFPPPALSLMLSIDLRIQQSLEQALEETVAQSGAKSAQGVVLDPASGEVLAMAVYPTFNPNNYSQEDPVARRNKVIEFPFEPGSVMKPLTACALVQYKKVNNYETVYCEGGHWNRGRWTISDSHGHGSLNLPQVIAYSSNIGIAKFSQRLSANEMHTVMTGLGLGSRTKIDLPAEDPGALPQLAAWRGITKDVMAYGHSMMVTTLQLAAAYGTVGHGGVWVRPHVARAWAGADGAWRPVEPAETHRVLSPDAAGQVALYMLGVTEMQGGTGRRAAVPGYRVAGKTGTAEKLKNGHYDKTKNVATFAGFAPVAAPRVVAVISVDEPLEGGHTGGLVAAPPFATVMTEALRLLHVTPDFIPEPAPEPQVAAAPSPSKETAGPRPERTTLQAPAVRQPAPAAAAGKPAVVHAARARQ